MSYKNFCGGVFNAVASKAERQIANWVLSPILIKHFKGHVTIKDHWKILPMPQISLSINWEIFKLHANKIRVRLIMCIYNNQRIKLINSSLTSKESHHILTACSFFGIKLPSSSIGSGKMIVEFFSAEIDERVWRYLEIEQFCWKQSLTLFITWAEELQVRSWWCLKLPSELEKLSVLLQPQWP